MSRSKKARKRRQQIGSKKPSMNSRPNAVNNSAQTESNQVETQPQERMALKPKKEIKKLPISMGGFGLFLVLASFVLPIITAGFVSSPMAINANSHLLFSLPGVLGEAFILVGGLVSLLGATSKDGRISGTIGAVIAAIVLFLVLGPLLKL